MVKERRGEGSGWLRGEGIVKVGEGMVKKICQSLRKD